MKLRILRSAKGQAILETVLMSFVILTLWLGLTAALRKTQFLQTVFGTPWARLNNTVEFGIPVTNKQQAGPSHPTSYARHSTLLNGG